MSANERPSRASPFGCPVGGPAARARPERPLGSGVEGVLDQACQNGSGALRRAGYARPTAQTLAKGLIYLATRGYRIRL